MAKVRAFISFDYDNDKSKYLSQIKFKKLGNDGFSLAYSGLKSPIPNENNMG